MFPHRLNTRNMIRACLAYTRMLFVHERLMSSAREYLIPRVTELLTSERNLSDELSILRAASSPENWEQREVRDLTHDLFFAPNIREHHSEQLDSSNLDRETILREMDKSEFNLCKLSEEIVHKREIIHDIDARIEDASFKSLVQEHQSDNEKASPSHSVHEPTTFEGLVREGRTRGRISSLG